MLSIYHKLLGTEQCGFALTVVRKIDTWSKPVFHIPADLIVNKDFDIEKVSRTSTCRCSWVSYLERLHMTQVVKIKSNLCAVMATVPSSSRKNQDIFKIVSKLFQCRTRWNQFLMDLFLLSSINIKASVPQCGTWSTKVIGKLHLLMRARNVS